MNVLVVEDNPIFRRYIVDLIFTMEVDDVVTASNGVRALHKLQDRSFQLIIADWKMPQMDGLQLLKEVRETDPDVPFVLLTNVAGDSERKEAMEAGATGYVTKDIGHDGLIQAFFPNIRMLARAENS